MAKSIFEMSYDELDGMSLQLYYRKAHEELSEIYKNAKKSSNDFSSVKSGPQVSELIHKKWNEFKSVHGYEPKFLFLSPIFYHSFIKYAEDSFGVDSKKIKNGDLKWSGMTVFEIFTEQKIDYIGFGIER